MSGQEDYSQQLIVPAYVWENAQQREACLTACARTLAARANRDGKQVVGQLVDARLQVTFLQAVVGTAETGEQVSVDFVAYEPCPEPAADLVSVVVTATVSPVTASSD